MRDSSRQQSLYSYSVECHELRNFAKLKPLSQAVRPTMTGLLYAVPTKVVQQQRYLLPIERRLLSE